MDSKIFKKKYFLIFLAAIIGTFLIVLSTTKGPGIGGDSTIYITSARNFASGKGLGLIEMDGSFRLLPYSAPLFPIILSQFKDSRNPNSIRGLRFEYLIF
ncbi:MAG: hypothetical protein AB9891_11735 [Anaerolineaceae bacterium]